MALYAIEYVYDPNRTEDINRIRPDHRAHLRSLQEQGVVRIAGAWIDDPQPGAFLAVEAESAQGALDALSEDPFFLNQLILERKVHQWKVVIGEIS